MQVQDQGGGGVYLRQVENLRPLTQAATGQAATVCDLVLVLLRVTGTALRLAASGLVVRYYY